MTQAPIGMCKSYVVQTKFTKMNMFHGARVVKLGSYHKDMYLHAVHDQKSVIQRENGSTNNHEWTVEFVPGSDSLIRLKSCYGMYLTASNDPFLLGSIGFHVHQTLPANLDSSSIEWEPIRVGNQVVKLKNSRRDTFLRASNRLPPQPYSVTHKVPLRSSANNFEWRLVIVATAPEQHSLSTPEMKANQGVPEAEPELAPAAASKPGFWETANPAINIANLIVGATKLATTFTDSGQGKDGDAAGASDAGNAPTGDAGNAATGDGTGFSDFLGGVFN